MSDHDQKISTWRQQRKKGLFRFIVSRSLPAFLGVLIGKIIGAVLFTDNGFIALVIAFPLLSIIHWRWKERKLRRHDEKYNPKSLENNND